MIQRLTESLRALAAPADVQCARFPDFVVRADELALEFADAYLLVRDCPQMMLSSHQEDALTDLDLAVTAMTGPTRAPLWTEDALREHPDWRAIRQLAAAALHALDASGSTRPLGSTP